MDSELLSIYLQPIIPNITKNAFEFLNSTDKKSLEDLDKHALKSQY